MKVKCPICEIEGFLEKRGNSFRIKHYVGFENGDRKYTMHKVGSEQLDLLGISKENVNQYMGISLKDSSLFSKKSRGCRLAWSRLVDLGSIDPGPNPGSPTIFHASKQKIQEKNVHARRQISFCCFHSSGLSSLCPCISHI